MLWYGLQQAGTLHVGLIVEDLQTLHIPTNKKLEVCTQYLFLSLVATSLLSRKY